MTLCFNYRMESCFSLRAQLLSASFFTPTVVVVNMCAWTSGVLGSVPLSWGLSLLLDTSPYHSTKKGHAFFYCKVNAHCMTLVYEALTTLVPTYSCTFLWRIESSYSLYQKIYFFSCSSWLKWNGKKAVSLLPSALNDLKSELKQSVIFTKSFLFYL